ncbi:MAG: hypothetical protein HZA24_04835 [Nitrospirae bacterium]|nr:hypothetical protein [Nitrospirota bacterium]
MGHLTHAISLAGKGVHKARHLSADEAAQAMGAILDGLADPFELGGFLVAMRVKEETAEELTAFVTEAQRRLTAVPGPAPMLTVPCYAGKRQTFPALIGSACSLAACGVTVGLHGHGNVPGRTALVQVLEALGAKPGATPADAAAQLARAGVAYVGVEAFFPMMHRMLELRERMGLRSCFHTMARLVNPFHAPRQMVGISHERTFDKFAQACHALGFAGVLSFRGMEGEAEPNPLAATEGFRLEPDGAVAEFSIDPHALGIPRFSRHELMANTPEQAAAMVRAALDGEGPARHAVALGAATGLLAAGAEADLKTALERASKALADGSARARLDAWLA